VQVVAARPRNERIRGYARRSREVLGLAALVGVATGFAVVGFERAVNVGLDWLRDAPLWVAVSVPALGIAVTRLALHFGKTTPATSDDYLREYHEPEGSLPLRYLPAKFIGGLATLGTGGAMGLEGPSIFIGATLGSATGARVRRLLTNENVRVLMVAGAAAGVAAIFKAPATGAVFAIEVPYQGDFGRRLLLPALVGGATGYLAFVVVDGTGRLFPVHGTPGFSLRDLGGALVLGILAAGVARVFARMLLLGKDLSGRLRWWQAIVGGGAAFAGLALVADAAAGAPLTLGPGYDVIRWARDPHLALELVALMLLLRCLATATSVGSGGVGGLFIPLVVAGALLGRFVGGAFDALDTELFTVIGIAAVLGAGFRVPLAAVIFVAETTGQPGFIVPGILAAVVAELLMGTSSVTRYQRAADTV
jgi:CIC family chloride channel protein